eukprot:3327970-Pyramimonas_sp.AAC.1
MLLDRSRSSQPATTRDGYVARSLVMFARIWTAAIDIEQAFDCAGAARTCEMLRDNDRFPKRISPRAAHANEQTATVCIDAISRGFSTQRDAKHEAEVGICRDRPRLAGNAKSLASSSASLREQASRTYVSQATVCCEP